MCSVVCVCVCVFCTHYGQKVHFTVFTAVLVNPFICKLGSVPVNILIFQLNIIH
jgi:hypothetical protein